MLKIIKQYHDKDIESIKCCYVIALEKHEKKNFKVKISRP